MKNICILGGGSWGTALALVLAKKGYHIDLWLRDKKQCDEINNARENLKYLQGILLPNNINVTYDIAKAVSNKKIIVSAVPTHGVRETMKTIKNHICNDPIIVNVAKGIEVDTLLRISEIVSDEIPNAEYTILSGPSHAEEVARDIPTTVVAASTKKLLQSLFKIFL